MQKCAYGATRWVPETGLHIDVARELDTTVISRFAQSDGLICMIMSARSLESLITKFRDLHCASASPLMGFQDKKSLQDCQIEKHFSLMFHFQS